jgi:metal-responsive CopG/Arc/MetJ family transcriptional regulator
MAMQRTQIYLEPELAEALDRLARRRGTSRGALIRLAARRLLSDEQPAEDDPILGIIGLGHGGPGRVSEEHDRVLAEHQRSAHTR